jgi:DNA-binding response OmpR family regulator
MDKKTLLIVEDDATSRQILHARLRAQGYEVALAPDAVSALSEAQRTRPDLIVLDLGLPAGGGMVVLSRLRSFPRLAVIPVLVNSMNPRETHEAAALEAGASAYVHKTDPPEVLLAAIRGLLGESEPPAVQIATNPAAGGSGVA